MVETADAHISEFAERVMYHFARVKKLTSIPCPEDVVPIRTLDDAVLRRSMPGAAKPCRGDAGLFAAPGERQPFPKRGNRAAQAARVPVFE